MTIINIGKLSITFSWGKKWQQTARKGPEYLIQAIKEYRILTGASLRDSKDTVEAYLNKINKSRPAFRWLRY